MVIVIFHYMYVLHGMAKFDYANRSISSYTYFLVMRTFKTPF